MPNRTSSLAAARPRTPRARIRADFLGGPAAILISTLLWGTTGTAGSLAPAGAPAAAVGCAGLTLGGLLLHVTSRAARALPAACTRRERWLLLLGALAVAGYPVTFYPATARTGVAVATVIALGSAPVFVGLLSWALGGPRPTTRWTCATAAAVLGCALLVLGPEFSGSGEPVDLTGALLAACGGLSYAVYSLIGGRLIADGHPSDAVMGVLFGAAGVLVLPVVAGTDTRWLTEARGAGVALYLALFTVCLAYRLFGHGLRVTSASVATTLTLGEPAVAAVLGVAVLGERLPLVSWGGLAVLAAGVGLLTVGAGVQRGAGEVSGRMEP